MSRDALDLGSWCILRMASGDTLKVAKSLSDAGLTVWTPVERHTSRKPRSQARTDRTFALMPSYVFGHVRDLDELLRAALSPKRDSPAFSVFHHLGGIPLIADYELEALRGEEARLGRVFDKHQRKGQRGPTFGQGETVKITEGGFAGLSGVVQDQRGQYTLVSFDGFHGPVKVSSLLLLSDSDMDRIRSGSDLAARAA
jgi:transcription antitermination factor NusG